MYVPFSIQGPGGVGVLFCDPIGERLRVPGMWYSAQVSRAV